MGEYVRGKYNTGKSLKISDFSEEELREAIKDWSQGYESMENFLWECYHNGVETFGTHMGTNMYVDFLVETSKRQLLRKIIVATLREQRTCVMFSNGLNNPSASDSLDRHTVLIGKDKCKNAEELGQFLNYILDYMKREDELPEEELADDILELASFFIDQKSDIGSFRIDRQEDLTYTFEINPSLYLRRSGKLNEFFTNLGMETKFDEEHIHEGWTINAENMQDLMAKVKRIKESIIESKSGYFELPKKIEKHMNLYTVYKIKEAEFGDSLEGKERLKQWLKQMRELWDKTEATKAKEDYIRFDDFLYPKEQENELEQSITDMSSYGEITTSQVANARAEVEKEEKPKEAEKDEKRM